MSSRDTYSEKHPHAEPPVLDADGRCLVCVQIVEHEKWVATPDGQTVVEAGAEALFTSKWGTLVYRGAPEDMKDELRDAARAVLLAALRVRRMTPCPDCGGNVDFDPKCANCGGGGVVPGVPLLVDALMEPYGWGCGHGFGKNSQDCDSGHRLYRVRGPGAAQ